MPQHSQTEKVTADGGGHQAGRYLAGAVDLQNSIDYNLADSEFAEQHGEIRYVLDTNVIRFFLNPFKSEEYLKVTAFDRPPTHTMQALATVTAEFLMSRHLAGQWGAAPMISPAHAREIADHARHLGQQARTRIVDSDIIGIEETITRLMNCRKSTAQLRETIDDTLDPLGGIGALLENEAFEAREFTRVIQENLLRPLHMDEMANPRVLGVSEEEIQGLRDLLALHRVDKERRTTPKNINHDAETLIQIMRLNEVAQKRFDEGRIHRPIRYVLVSSDQGLYNAAIDWFAASGNSKPAFFPLRRLGQYIPFLNTAEMPNNIKSTQIFEDVQRAVAAFLLTVWGRTGIAPRPLPRWDHRTEADDSSKFHAKMQELAQLMSSRAERDPAYQNTLQELKTLWDRLSRETVFLNARLLGRRIDAFNALSTFLSDADDVRSAVLELISDTVAGVERAHAKFSVQHNLAAIIEELRDKSGDHSPRRGVAVPLSRFQDVVDDPLFEFLTRFVSDPDSTRMEVIIEKLGQVPAHRAFFFSATVAFWASRWESALFFVERALEIAPDDADPKRPHELHDLRYFAQVVRRYEIMDRKVLSADDRLPLIRGLIKPAQALLYSAEDERNIFLICRSELELAMIYVMLAFGAHSTKNQLDLADADAAQEQGRIHVLKAIEELPHLAGQPDEEVMQLMTVELVIAFAANILYQMLYTTKDPRRDAEVFRPLVEQVGALFDKSGDTLPEIYTLMPRLMELIYVEDKDARNTLAQDVLAQLAAVKAMQGSMTRLDRETSAVFAKKLMDFLER